MLIATSGAVFGLQANGTTSEPSSLWEGDVSCIAEQNGTQVISTSSGEVLLRGDGEARSMGLLSDVSIESLLILETDPVTVLAGTEPPHVYRLVDRQSPERIAAFDRLECREEWYTPWGGPAAVRSFAVTSDGWVYADIHVGSVMRSRDFGDSWEPVTPDLHVDVQQVAVSQADDDRVYANTADAVFVSNDRGRSWSRRGDGLPYLYGRAVTAHPTDPECVMATVSHGPGAGVEGRLFRSDDEGCTWQHVDEGFPSTTVGNIDTFQVAFTSGGDAWACVGDGLYKSKDKGRHWEEVWKAPADIAMLACSR